MEYTLYNRETYEIIGAGRCPEKDFMGQIQNPLIEAVVEGFGNGLTQKVVDEKIVDKTPQEIIDDTPVPPKPRAIINEEEWEDIKNRISVLESEV